MESRGLITVRRRGYDEVLSVVSFDVGISANEDSQNLEALVGVIDERCRFSYISNRKLEVISYRSDLIARRSTATEKIESYRNGKRSTIPSPEDAGMQVGWSYPVIDISDPIRNHKPVDAYITVVNHAREIWCLSSNDLIIEIDRMKHYV